MGASSGRRLKKINEIVDREEAAAEMIRMESEAIAGNTLAVQQALEEISAIGQAVAEASMAAEEAKNQAEAAKTAAETAQLEALKQATIAAEKAAQLNNATAVTDLFEVIDGVLYIR